MKKLLISFFLTAASLSTYAAPPTLEGQHKNWTCQSVTEGGKKCFYIVSEAIESKGKYKIRGPVFLMINREGKKDVVSFVAGYQFKPKTSAQLHFDDGKNFLLFTDGDRAWAKDDKADKEIVQRMKKAKFVTVKGTTSKNNETTDKFDLAGFSAAYAVLK